MQAVGLQTYIWNNNLRSIFLLAGFPFLLFLLVYAVMLVMLGMGMGHGGYDYYASAPPNVFAEALSDSIKSLPAAIVIALIWFAIAYFANQGIIDLATGARPIGREDDEALYNLLENLSISRGMKTPTLRLIESPDLNAFATGLHEGQFSITVTRGLLEKLDRDELEAVLGHELTHIINRDVRTMIIAAVFAGIISLVAQVMARMLWFRVGGRRGGGALVLIGVGAAALAWFLAIVIRMAISRRREYIADAGSVELTKNPDAMISALQKVAGHAHLDAPEEVRGLFLENHEEGFFGLFATHPPIEARIQALVEYAGGHIVERAPDPATTPGVYADNTAPQPAPSAAADGNVYTSGDDQGPWGGRPAQGGPWNN